MIYPPYPYLHNLTQSHLSSISHLPCMTFQEREMLSHYLVKGIFILPLYFPAIFL